MKWAWATIKIGAIPYIVLAVPVFVGQKIWAYTISMGFKLSGNYWLDVPLNILIVASALLLSGYLIRRPIFQNFVKDYLVLIPYVGPVLYATLVPHEDIVLLEVQTYDGSWEYGLKFHDWVEDGVRWYRVHTLGFGSGKLFSRVYFKNIRLIPDNRQRDAWATLLSMGLLSGEKKEEEKKEPRA